MSDTPATASTHGSDEREARELFGPVMRFDISAEAERLRGERPYQDGDRNARTLAKEDAFRLVLVALRSGATFDEGAPEGYVSVDVLEGAVSVRADGGSTDASAGQIVTIGAGQRWSAEAKADSLLLLHLTWPPSPGSV